MTHSAVINLLTSRWHALVNRQLFHRWSDWCPYQHSCFQIHWQMIRIYEGWGCHLQSHQISFLKRGTFVVAFSKKILQRYKYIFDMGLSRMKSHHSSAFFNTIDIRKDCLEISKLIKNKNNSRSHLKIGARRSFAISSRLSSSFQIHPEPVWDR